MAGLTVDASFVYNVAADPTGHQIVDFRDQDCFEKMHIRQAQHCKSMKRGACPGKHVVIVQGSTQFDRDWADEFAASVHAKSVRMLSGTFQAFHTTYPFMCEESLHSAEARQARLRDSWSNLFPAEIIPGVLYLGGQDHGQSIAALKALRMGHVVSLVKKDSRPRDLPSSVSWTNFAIDDAPEANITALFEPAFQIFFSALETGSPMLVHCKHGKSRAPTLVIAIMLKHRNMSLAQAYSYVFDRRHGLNVNPGFMRQLAQFELSMRGTSSVRTGA
eukprot:CAMPEP_0114564808 /NCGR_PEP_ID=MMETSP0114-20121206/13943_1 /TAXON_ID=31324 /ORGANISM="Goniomonas sp, Strain m" /LENGTH=274 /DNA_ID=CAMNT_0001750951 /DNA_START=65 /DNA_END=886 /DNA_ORIENTATION=+